MERTLRANEGKGGWCHCAPAYLLRRITEECCELRRELDNETPVPHRVVAEAVDVANFAMMLADNHGPGSAASTASLKE